MNNVYIFEGRTSTEAIEKGLKELKTSRNKVDIKVLEQEEKRSFFSILTPRIVKVEIKLKEERGEDKKENKNVAMERRVDNSETVSRIRNFLDVFIDKLPSKDLSYSIKDKNDLLEIEIKGEDTGYLIGYRGEVLNSIQTVITNIASKSNKEKIKVLVNIGGYREKREKDLQNLAVKIAGTVMKTKKSITLEPMSAYERKIIHTKLQENDKIKTYSVGEEPYRKIVVSLK